MHNVSRRFSLAYLILTVPLALFPAAIAGAQHRPSRTRSRPSPLRSNRAARAAGLACGLLAGQLNQPIPRALDAAARRHDNRASHTVMGGKTQDFEFLRMESRPDGECYVAAPAGKAEALFKLTGKSTDQDDEIFTFANRVNEFPQTIIYRRGAKGWLYAHVEGTDRRRRAQGHIPMRRTDCETGDVAIQNSDRARPLSATARPRPGWRGHRRVRCPRVRCGRAPSATRWGGTRPARRARATGRRFFTGFRSDVFHRSSSSRGSSFRMPFLTYWESV